MKPGTKDEIQGKFHEVKGKVKEKAGKVTNNSDLESKGIAEYHAGNVGKNREDRKPGRTKKGVRGKLGGFFPEHISACGSGDPGVTLALGVLYSSGPHIFRSTNQPVRRASSCRRLR
jgi:uncharacterized protein YjbJ (UPF0337 family)